MKRTLFLKLFGGSAVIVLCVSLLIFVLSSATLKSDYEDGSAHNLESLGRVLQPDIEALLDGGRISELDPFVKQTEKRAGARVTVIDPQGVVLADSERDPASMENHRYRPEVAEALDGRIGRSIRLSPTIDARMLYVGLPLLKDGGVRGVLRLSYFMSSIERVIGRLRSSIGRAVLIVAGLALLAALWLSLHFNRPIVRLTQAARRVAGGDFRARVHIRNRDEFRALGDVFNRMTEQIERLFADLTGQKENLSNIIASIEEGLAVVDKDGRIVLANESFDVLAGGKSVQGRYFWEVIRNPKVKDLVAEVRREREGLSREFRVGDKDFLCVLSYLGSQDGVVLIFHDLTEMRRVEDIKRDFVVNASHELRTPLSAIRGAAEVLEDEKDPAERAAALQILKRHAARLTGIVEDLLKLGELEDQGFKLDLQDVDGSALAAGVARVFEPQAGAKGLELRVESAPGLPRFKGDPGQIERMLINLVENAVKYTEKGSVVIGLRTEGESFVFEVADTGIGIPAGSLSRIFERFYVVDKSRSRRMGGTGLGLAIVKHIVQLHGGTVTADSLEGRWTKFTVRLPLRGPDVVEP